jgi:hypothetical protein
MQTSIEIFGVKVLEPMATLTDLLVAGVCFYAFIKLHRGGSREKSVVYFKYFFLCMSVSTTLGGIIGHGFLYAFGFAWKLPGWVVGMSSVAFMERAAIKQARPVMHKGVNTFLAYMNLIELGGFIFIAFYTLNFFYVEIHAAYGLMVVFFLESFVYQKKRDRESRFILFGVAVSALAAFVHIAKFSLHTWFNYIDLSHVFMAIGSYLFYLGAEKPKRA